jgi:hypothetical protein
MRKSIIVSTRNPFDIKYSALKPNAAPGLTNNNDVIKKQTFQNKRSAFKIMHNNFENLLRD